MTKAVESLTAQLRDVARAFCLEVWGQALSAAGVDTKSELRAPDKVYYPLALRLAPTPSLPPADTSSAPQSSSAQLSDDPSSTLAKCKEKKKELPPSMDAPNVMAEEDMPEGVPLKRKKKEKEQEKKGAQEQEPTA